MLSDPFKLYVGEDSVSIIANSNEVLLKFESYLKGEGFDCGMRSGDIEGNGVASEYLNVDGKWKKIFNSLVLME